MISKIVRQNEKEQEQLMNALRKEISKIGKSEAWFFEKMDQSNTFMKSG
jgi:hypothetical protein